MGGGPIFVGGGDGGEGGDEQRARAEHSNVTSSDPIPYILTPLT